MIIKFTYLVFLIFIFSACYTPSYILDTEYIDQGVHGAYIKVYDAKAGKTIKGELIVADEKEIIVLEIKSNRAIISKINRDDVRYFRLKYAKSSDYSWTIPVYALLTLSHGWYSIITLPINLIVTISVTASGPKSLSYSDKTIAYSELKMFARFPQGFPDNVFIGDIR